MKLKKQLTQMAKTVYMKKVEKSSKTVKRAGLLNEIAYLLSFPQNDKGLIAQLLKDQECGTVVIYYTEKCRAEIKKYEALGIDCFCLNETRLLFKTLIPRISRSRFIICDNYFAFLGGLSCHPETTIFQIWHANGAIKTFGWQDAATSKRTSADRKRFQAVYDKVDYYVVGSDKMGVVFQRSYNLKGNKILKTGCPRTDYYFEKNRRDQAVAKFRQAFPEWIEKRVVLYVPTYRPTDNTVIQTSLKELAFPKDCVAFAHLHPHMKDDKTEDGVTNLAVDFRGLSFEELLYSTDVLITDYSSVPFEYSLVNPKGQVLFYCPDFETYSTEVGLQSDFINYTEEERSYTIEALRQKLEFKRGVSAGEYADSWNEYNDGNATARLIEFMKTK